MNDLDAIRGVVFADARRRQPVVPWWHDVAKITFINAMVATIVIVAVRAGAPELLHPRAFEPLWWTTFVLFVVVAVAGCWLALRPATPAVVHFSVLMLAATTVALALANAPRWHAGGSFLADADCALVETGISFLPAAALAWALTSFVYRRSSALVGGIAAGTTGMLVLHVTCPVEGADHMLAFHAVPYALVALVLLLVRSRLRSRSVVP